MSAEPSILSTGHWVKIKVSETGIQQITFDQLRQWGFEDPEAVTVYGFGGAAFWDCWSPADTPDAIPQQYSIINNDRIIFYGEGASRVSYQFRSSTTDPALNIQRNNASNDGYYFLTDSQPKAEVSEIPFVSSATRALTNHDHIYMAPEEEIVNPSGFGQHFFGSDITKKPNQTVQFNVPLPDRDTNESTMVYVTNVIGVDGSNPKFQVDYTKLTGLNSAVISFTTTATSSELKFDNNFGKTSSFIKSSVDASATRFDLKLHPTTSASFTWAAHDFFGLYYSRKNIFYGGEMPMFYRSITSQRRIEVENTDETTLVWNVESPFAVRPYAVVHEGTKLVFTNHRNYSFTNSQTHGRMIVFDPAATHRSVEYAGEVENVDLRSVEVPDLLIITSELCEPQAQRLADLHRNLLGHTVLVVKQEEIFNEFSSGTPAVNAIRRFAQYLYSRPGGKFKNILFFGPASTDLRGLTGSAAVYKKEGNLLLTYPTFDRERQRSNIRSFTSDVYFGALSDIRSESAFLSSKIDVAVGRIPARSIDEAEKAVTKIENYLTNMPSSDVFNRNLLLSESHDNHSHLDNSEKVSKEFGAYDPGATTVKVYNAFYPRTANKCPMATEALKQAFSMGVGYFNFSGHGKPDSFTKFDVWNSNLVENTDYDVFPYAMLATCDSYMFDQLTPSIAEQMVFKPNGGAIAVVGACRTVYETNNQTLNQLISRYYAQATDGTTTGELFRKAVTEITYLSSNEQLLINDRCYNLCGDPALPLYTAEKDMIELTSINGAEFIPYRYTSLAPLVPNEITGHILNDKGEVDKTFNGSVILTLYEAGRRVNTTDLSGSNNNAVILDEDQLTSVKATVSEGQFTASLTCPMPVRKRMEPDSVDYNHNRITMLAMTHDNTRRVKGYHRTIQVSNDYPETMVDTEAPVIESLYIDSPNFVDGDAVSDEFRIYATIAPDESGIKVTTGNVGGATRIIIDGSRIIPVLGSSMNIHDDGTIDISMPVNSIADGYHSATLNITDNSGNSASRTIHFVVVNRPGEATLEVEETPARIYATLSLNHTYSGDPSGRLVIEDSNGNMVYSRENTSFPFEWDLTDGETPVADGVYSAYVVFSSGLQYGSTPKTDIIVVQKQ